MIARARGWLAGRSPRERALLGVLAALVTLMLIWFVVIAPINAARLAAQLRLQTATIERGRVLAAVASVRGARMGARAQTPPLAALVMQSAQTAGFELARREVVSPTRIAIGITSARSPALFAWLGVLEAQGVVAERLTLRPNSDATLSVEGVLSVRGG